MKQKPVPLTQSSQYESFVKQRDVQLEEILAKYILAANFTIEFLRKRALEIASHLGASGYGRENLRQKREEFKKRYQPFVNLAIDYVVMLIQDMRRTVYGLSYVGQAEAIARAMGDSEITAELTRKKIHDSQNKPMPMGGSIHLRVELYFQRLERKVTDAFQLSQVLALPGKDANGEDAPGETLQEMLDRIERAFPTPKRYRRPKRVMARLTEANRPKGDVDISTTIVDDDEWQRILDDYKAEALPASDYRRAPYDKIFYAEQTEEGIETYTRYEWELEQEMTQDFVDRVRDGEEDAAKENGVTDFQWIAIIDDRTDDCCSWRDGLTTKEIEDQLEGEHSDDDCDVSVPPAHFNCRCRLAPMTDDMPEEPQPTEGDFYDWLDAKAQEK